MWLTFDQRRGLERLWLSVVENLSKTCSWPTLDPVVGYSKKKKKSTCKWNQAVEPTLFKGQLYTNSLKVIQ